MLPTRRVASYAPRIFSQRRLISTCRPFAEQDLVLLRQTNDRTAPPILSKPLTPGKTIQNHKGVIRHSDILGKEPRDIVTAVKASKNSDGTIRKKAETHYRVQPVKLEEYIRLSRRLVTPIYAADAAVIVELLDIHIEPSSGDEPKLEILEAGTGHGALTLYLARAIHGTNLPLWEERKRRKVAQDPTTEPTDHETSEAIDERRAIIHSIELSPRYSQHAQDVVHNFRHGLYSPNIDFHVADISSWLGERAAEDFLSHAFLDLPSADRHVASVAAALKTNGTLVVFNPSVTQILDVARAVREQGVELELETVVELGTNGGSGGREWDVRPVRPRAARGKGVEVEVEVEVGEAMVDKGELGEGEAGVSDSADSSAPAGSEEEGTEDEAARQPVATPGKDEWSMVCRPKVGDRVIGGGFLGVWKKKRVEKPEAVKQEE